MKRLFDFSWFQRWRTRRRARRMFWTNIEVTPRWIYEEDQQRWFAVLIIPSKDPAQFQIIDSLGSYSEEEYFLLRLQGKEERVLLDRMADAM